MAEDGTPAAPAPWLSVDWQAPWWDGVRECGAEVLARGLPLHEALNARWAAARAPSAAGALPPVRFVPQSALPEGRAYEAHLWAARECPTRDNAHDFLNGLMWMRWPLAKRRINELQAAEIARDGVGPVRGPVRDALTLLDENGVLLQAPAAVRAELLQALRARDWRRLFVELRPLWRQARLQVLGHALLEKLLQPRKDITAHLWWDVDDTGPETPVDAPPDAALARSLVPARLARKPFLPLPVLGVPGWWPANDSAAFYDDPSVFRPPRAAPG